ncbi:hypothetical protein GOQ27_07015 [Clostridium sp. D2Q-11]|uniref:Phage protein n=1 Tax=Anaeromonas frigoriresistens TaxID=2683708 RepID=A0A942Z722_9FIRM|nr:hypothetical protein [Anaeromonas frigoriresistens]MBS4538207.1 hypothetical protein [Anaeromonas frigoriresistens]
MAKLSKKKQNELIDEEINKMLDLFKDISEDKKELAMRLIERVAFMTITLQILEDNIKTKGPTYNFVQGSQKMIVENPSQKSYNTMINRYTTAYDKLINLLPKEPKGDVGDGFEKFVNSRTD